MNGSSKIPLLIAALAFFNVAHACSCIFPTLKGAYFSPQTERFVRATPIFKGNLPTNDFNSVYYIINVQTDYKGCKGSKFVTVRTSPSSASCGVFLTIGTSYILPLGSGSTPSINSCQFIRQYASLSTADLNFLNSRQLCCKGRCVCASGKPPVNCFAEPCRVTRPPCPQAVKCVNNYCGGCFAEWFTKDGSTACPSGISGSPSAVLASS